MHLLKEFLYSKKRLAAGALMLLLLFLPGKQQAQDYRAQQHQILAYNLLLNGVVGGVGGLIHKTPGEKGWKVFTKNFAKGALGGLVIYSAKYQTYYLRQPNNTFVAPANRLYYFLGNSMVRNASMNKKLLSEYTFNLYGLDMVMNFGNKEEKFFKARLSLATMGSFASFVVLGHRFDFHKSLEYGIFYFNMNPSITQYGGFATFNCIAILRNQHTGGILYSAIPHEFVHTYQFYDYHAISNLYTPAMEPKYKRIKYYSTLARYFKLDYEVWFQSALYLVQPSPRYYKNFYEFEAQHFSTRNYINRK